MRTMRNLRRSLYSSDPALLFLFALDAQCIWFGVAMLLNPYFYISTNLFPSYGDGVQLVIGIFALVVGCVAVYWPEKLGAIAGMLVSCFRGYQAWVTNNGYACGVWTIFIAVLLGFMVANARAPRKRGAR